MHASGASGGAAAVKERSVPTRPPAKDLTGVHRRTLRQG